MLLLACPKLPMRQKASTIAFYVDVLGFTDIGQADYPDYLLLQKEDVELHFFSFPGLDPLANYGQVYLRVTNIKELYEALQQAGVAIHPNAPLQQKPWGMWEFAFIDPDGNLITVGEDL